MNPNEPLGLPHGSVRAILALMVVGATVGAYALSGQVAEGLIGIAGMVIGYYFGTRSGSGPAEPELPEPVAGDED